MFLLVGTIRFAEFYNLLGLVILYSDDGLTWRTVLREPPDNKAAFFTQSNFYGTHDIVGAGTQKFCFAVVWNPDDKKFYAGVHNEVVTVEQQPGTAPGGGGNITLPDGTVIFVPFGAQQAIFTTSIFDEVYSSDDGKIWKKTESITITATHVFEGYIDHIEILATGPTDDNGNYNGNLLAKHCSKRVLDKNGLPQPDGIYGYDKKKNILITPEVMPAIIYGTGTHDPTFIVLDPFHPERGGEAKSTVKVIKKDENGKDITKIVDTGVPQVWSVAFAGGVWQAAGGGITPNQGSMVATSIDDGETWTRVETGIGTGDSSIETMSGGGGG